MTPPIDDDLPQLGRDEVARYGRHLTLPEVGMEGQRRIKAARVLVVGAGGLGSPAALYLASAGVGTIGIVDFDRVDLSNLQRQLLHGTKDVGRPKVESARDRLRDANPHVQVELHEAHLTSANALEILGAYDIIVDGTDNFATRYLTNDACVLLGKPNVHGAIFRFDGHASVFAAPDGPCYRCLFPEPPPPHTVPSCAEAGVLGALPGIIGTIQAIETLKLILGAGEPLVGRLLVMDALSMRFQLVRVPRDPQCPMCGTRTIRELVDYDSFCGDRPVDPSTHEETPDEISVAELAQRGRRGDMPEVVDVREPFEYELSHLAEARLIPLGQLQSALPQLDPEREIVVVCRTGARSGRAVAFMRQMGFSRARNLVGGMVRWRDEIDPDVLV